MKTIFKFLVLVGMGLAYSSYGCAMDKKEKVVVVCGMEEKITPTYHVLRVNTDEIDNMFKLSEEYMLACVIEKCWGLEEKKLAAQKVQKLWREKERLLQFLRVHKHTNSVSFPKATYTSGISANNDYREIINQLEQDLEFLRFLVRRCLTASNTH